jgi:hypothetical protein
MIYVLLSPAHFKASQCINRYQKPSKFNILGFFYAYCRRMVSLYISQSIGYIIGYVVIFSTSYPIKLDRRLLNMPSLFKQQRDCLEVIEKQSMLIKLKLLNRVTSISFKSIAYSNIQLDFITHFC